MSMTLLETFGATSDDAASLRIPSLKEMTVDDLERMWVSPRPPGRQPGRAADGRRRGSVEGARGGGRCRPPCVRIAARRMSRSTFRPTAQAAGGKDMEGDAAPAEGGAAPAGDAPAAGGAADGGSLGGDAGGDGGN